MAKAYRLTTALILLLSAAVASPTWAAAPDILVDLKFDKTFFRPGEKIPSTVAVANRTGRDLRISKGFSDGQFYRSVKIVDPEGKLLRMKPTKKRHTEVPNTPPLPLVRAGNKLIQKIPCETLPASWKSTKTGDLREIYDFPLTGYYSVQVQVSATIYKGAPGDPCDVRDYEWSGIMSSETQYIFVHSDKEN